MGKYAQIEKEVNTVASIFKRMIRNVEREKVSSISNIVIMTVTFTLLGLLISMIIGSQTALKYLERQAQLTIFFKDDFSEVNILAYKSEMEADDRIDAIKYVSKDDAYNMFKEINKEEPLLLESISASILPASLEVRTKDIKNLSVLAEEVKSRDGVEEIKFYQDVIERFRNYTRIIYIVGAVLVIVFLLISYSVILSTLRSTIHSKGVELEILKLVGASNSYVRKPLIYQGVMFGLVSSFTASLIVAGIVLGAIVLPNDLFYAGLYLFFGPAFIIKPYVFSLILTLLLMLSGVLLGYFGSSSAVKKYLKY